MSAGIWYVAPAPAALALFFFVPVVASLGLSLTDFDLYAVADLANLRFAGLANYRRLLEEPVFWTALRNTAYFVALGAPLSATLIAAFGLDSGSAYRAGGSAHWRAMSYAPLAPRIDLTAGRHLS